MLIFQYKITKFVIISIYHRHNMSLSSCFSFLMTTDNHMGFKQNDHVRRKDSYMAFAEALQIAREQNVDFILLGGDLFHVNKPSSSVEHKCIKIIRQHMSAEVNRETSFRRVSGNFSHFEKLNHANFEDPNLTVPFPIMTIHGNHDDPTGPSAKSVCEKLATCGLLNYFGNVKSTTKDNIAIEPIVLDKNGIKIALYGIGFIPDQKLRAAFEKNELFFLEPPKDTFNVLVVHQNRIPHNKDKYIPDDMFPKFFHLIVRGHEHDTQSPEKIPNSEVDGLVYQPGSTVATSISPMEAAPKKVGLMSIRLSDPQGSMASRYKLEYQLIPLKCCRRMIFKDISQRQIFNHIKSVDQRRKLTPIEYRRITKDFVITCIKGLLKENESQNLSQPNEGSQGSIYDKLDRFKLPLLRIRLEYVHKSERFDELEVISAFYPGQVANRDIILFKKQKLIQNENGQTENVTFLSQNDEEEQDEFDVIDLAEEKRDTIDAMIEGYFLNKSDEERLQALSLEEYTDAVRGANEDGNVISRVLNKKKQGVLKRFKAALTSEEIAEKEFHEQDYVEKWLLAAFRGDEESKLGGDDEDIEVILCE